MKTEAFRSLFPSTTQLTRKEEPATIRQFMGEDLSRIERSIDSVEGTARINSILSRARLGPSQKRRTDQGELYLAYAMSLPWEVEMRPWGGAATDDIERGMLLALLWDFMPHDTEQTPPSEAEVRSWEIREWSSYELVPTADEVLVRVPVKGVSAEVRTARGHVVAGNVTAFLVPTVLFSAPQA